MYSWKDKVWDGIAIGLVGLTVIPILLFAPFLLIITKAVDKVWPTNYKDRYDHWQM